VLPRPPEKLGCNALVATRMIHPGALLWVLGLSLTDRA
jgi:hypothetical protein